jgi:hypothetical protein
MTSNCHFIQIEQFSKEIPLLAGSNWYISTCPSPHQSTQHGFNEHDISKVLSILKSKINEDIG